MVAKSLTKLVDEAIIPALLLIIAKLVGLFLASFLLNLKFEVENQSFLGIFPSIGYGDINAYILAENYSNLAMFIVAVLGTLYILIKAHFLHDSHVKPKLQLTLAKKNLEWLITSSYNLYHQALIWLIFLWLTVGFLVLSTALKITYLQISVAAFVIAANLTWVFVLDLEREIAINQNKS